MCAAKVVALREKPLELNQLILSSKVLQESRVTAIDLMIVTIGSSKTSKTKFPHVLEHREQVRNFCKGRVDNIVCTFGSLTTMLSPSELVSYKSKVKEQSNWMPKLEDDLRNFVRTYEGIPKLNGWPAIVLKVSA